MVDSFAFEGSTLVQREIFASEICGSHVTIQHYWLASVKINEKGAQLLFLVKGYLYKLICVVLK